MEVFSFLCLIEWRKNTKQTPELLLSTRCIERRRLLVSGSTCQETCFLVYPKIGSTIILSVNRKDYMFMKENRKSIENCCYLLNARLYDKFDKVIVLCIEIRIVKQICIMVSRCFIQILFENPQENNDIFLSSFI